MTPRRQGDWHRYWTRTTSLQGRERELLLNEVWSLLGLKVVPPVPWDSPLGLDYRKLRQLALQDELVRPDLHLSDHQLQRPGASQRATGNVTTSQYHITGEQTVKLSALIFLVDETKKILKKNNF